MYTLSRRFLGFAAAGALALSVAGIPARADDLAQNLGPVGPNEPILTTVGSKRVIAFYEPGGGHCTINVVVWDRSDDEWRFGGARSGQPEPSSDGSYRQRREQVDQSSVRRLCRDACARRHQQVCCRWSCSINPRSIGMSAHVTTWKKSPQVQCLRGTFWNSPGRNALRESRQTSGAKRHAEDNPRNSYGSCRRRADWRRGSHAAKEAVTPLERAVSTPRGQLKSPYADFAGVAEEGLQDIPIS